MIKKEAVEKNIPLLEFPNPDMTDGAQRWWLRKHRFFIVLDKLGCIVFLGTGYARARAEQVKVFGSKLYRAQLRGLKLYVECELVDDFEQELRNAGHAHTGSR